MALLTASCTICCFQVRAVLIMLIHHSISSSLHLRVLMISGASEKLFLKNRDVTCFFVTHSLAVIRFLPLVAMGKHPCLTSLCRGD